MKKYVSLYFLFFMCLNLFGQGREITYTEGNTKLKGYLAIPESAGKKPGVVVLHAWMGLTEFEKNSADKLANLGIMPWRLIALAKIAGQKIQLKQASLLANIKMTARPTGHA